MTNADGWAEAGQGCFVRRYDPWDVSIGVIAGAAGLLVVDTRCDLVQGRELVGHIGELSPLPVRAVINTHAHFDHVLGNGALREAHPHVALVAHESVPEAAREVARQRGLEPVPPDEVFSSVWSIDLGDRYVEVVHPGRGHTDGDVVVRVPDADVLYAGDIVEESGPPSYGSDCWPLEWPRQLELLIGLLSDRTVIVPGHGSVVDKIFAIDQRVDLADVAGQIQSLADTGVPLEVAVARDSWPFPMACMEHAIRRGYAHLGRA